LLSGVLANCVGSPGILQAVRLRNYLGTKKDQLVVIQEEVKKLHLESLQLEHSRIAQEREVRRVLGYAASDEIIFDFNTTDQY
jgi:hypothetical protein